MNNHTILNGEDVLVVKAITKEDDSQTIDIAFSIQRKIAKGFYTLVIISSPTADRTCKAIVERLKRLNSNSQTRFLYLHSKDLNQTLRTAKEQNETFYINEYNPLHEANKDSNTATWEIQSLTDQPLIQQKLNKTVLLLSHAQEYGIAPCVLLTGETGSGKTYTAELIAERLKYNGSRKGKFVPVNCGSLPKDHIDSFLFGVVGNKFTDVKESKGAIEEADNGVLFLDEIGNLSLDAQSHLLTFLDNGRYRRYGDQSTERQADCIIIFGTNANLKKEIIAGNFRRDLYARINSFEITLPSLATRITNPETGTQFLSYTIERMCKQHGGIALTDKANFLFRTFAMSFHWQHNFRDLKHFFENLVIEVLWDGHDNIVSAQLMSDAIQSFTQNYPADIAAEESTTQEAPIINSTLPIETNNLANYEIYTLKLLISICKTSTNKADAGRRFFNGKDITNHSDAIAKFLKRYGLKWDKDAEYHVSPNTIRKPVSNV